MSSPLQTLVDALDVKPLGDDRFEARSIEYLRPRVFGRRAARPGASHGRAHGAGPRVSRDPRRLPVSRRSEDSDRVRRAAPARRPALRAATSIRLSAAPALSVVNDTVASTISRPRSNDIGKVH